MAAARLTDMDGRAPRVGKLEAGVATGPLPHYGAFSLGSITVRTRTVVVVDGSGVDAVHCAVERVRHDGRRPRPDAAADGELTDGRPDSLRAPQTPPAAAAARTAGCVKFPPTPARTAPNLRARGTSTALRKLEPILAHATRRSMMPARPPRCQRGNMRNCPEGGRKGARESSVSVFCRLFTIGGRDGGGRRCRRRPGKAQPPQSLTGQKRPRFCSSRGGPYFFVLVVAEGFPRPSSHRCHLPSPIAKSYY